MHVQQQSLVFGQVRLDLNREVNGQGLAPANGERETGIKDLVDNVSVI